MAAKRGILSRCWNGTGKTTTSRDERAMCCGRAGFGNPSHYVGAEIPILGTKRPTGDGRGGIFSWPKAMRATATIALFSIPEPRP